MKRKVSNTCIAVIERDGVVYMAGDRRASWGWDQAQSIPWPKVSKRSDLLIGATGTGFLCTLIVDKVQYPKVPARGNLDSFMIEKISTAVYNELLERNLTHNGKTLHLPSDYSCEAIFVARGRAFSLAVCNAYEEDGSSSSMGTVTVEQIGIPYATGCGGQWAWGVLEEHEQLINAGKIKMSPEESLKRALKIAAKYSPGCDSKIDIINNKIIPKI